MIDFNRDPAFLDRPHGLSLRVIGVGAVLGATIWGGSVWLALLIWGWLT